MGLPASFDGPYGELRCDLEVVTWGYDESDALIYTRERCGGDLYVTWSMAVPVARDVMRVEPDDVGKMAVSSTWELRCDHGHVLSSANNDAGDTAEPFDAAVLLGSDEAPRL